MAKTQPQPIEVPSEEPEPSLVLGTFYGHTFTLADIGIMGDVARAIASNHSALYCLMNGIRQSIGDAGAGLKGDEADAKRGLRADAIRQGTVGIGGPRGPQMRGLDKYVFDQAVLVIQQALSSWNKANPNQPKKALPTGKGSAEAIREKVESLKSKPVWSRIEAEAKAKYEADQNLVAGQDLDLDF